MHILTLSVLFSLTYGVDLRPGIFEIKFRCLRFIEPGLDAEHFSMNVRGYLIVSRAGSLVEKITREDGSIDTDAV
jgi:hypothetical protein